MPSLRDIKRRIKSVKNTRQITKAMKMVSAAKLKKAQDDINAARPYAEKMLEFVSSLASKSFKAPHPLMSSRAQVRNIGALLLTSDRGLCGGYNTVMLRAAETFLREHKGIALSEQTESDVSAQKEPDASAQKVPDASAQKEPEASEQKEPEASAQKEPEASEQKEPEASEQKEPAAGVQEEPEAGAQKELKVSLSLIGKRGIEYFKRRELTVITSRPAGSGRPSYAAAAAAAQELIRLFVSGELDEVYVIYSEFKSVINQKPVVHRLLPIAAAAPAKDAEGVTSREGAEAVKEPFAEPEIPVIYEPSVNAVLSSLLPKYVEVQVFRALLESSASEHGARMTSMDSASKNASEMIGALTLKYNRVRQAAITKELMEIIGGAEALK